MIVKRLNNFLSKAKLIHNNKYNYSLVNYKHSQTKIKIICPEHGEFEQTPDVHLAGKGCKKCGLLKRTFSIKEFINKANKIHNNKYDYTHTIYKNKRTKIKIICPEHGEFEQLAGNHIQGRGCKKCKIYDKTYTIHIFLSKAKLIHNNKYNYSLVNYKHSQTKIKIICPEHGEFEQLAVSHLTGKGCKKCANDNHTGNYNLITLNRDLNLANKEATLYLIKHENLYKIGITTLSIFQRFNKSVQVISQLNNITLIEAFTKEQEILEQYYQYKEKPKNWKYGGDSEFLNLSLEQKNQIIIKFF